MNLEEISREWHKDAEIDTTDLGNETVKTGRLHAKYYRILVEEKAKLAKAQADLKRLAHAKMIFYTEGATPEEYKSMKWEELPRGKILKNEADRYVQADKDVIDQSLTIEAYKASVDFLIDIIKHINNRNWTIRNYLDYQKFLNGYG